MKGWSDLGVEIERKFLVRGDGWRARTTPVAIRQGYLCTQQGTAVRVRRRGQEAFLTIKGGKNGLARVEYEYPIPAADADEMLDALCRRPLIEKTRHMVRFDGVTWEVDEFAGDNAGLIIAEVELTSAEQTVALPPWAGREVSDDARFLNVNLVARPVSAWSAAEREAAGVRIPAS